MCSRDVRGVDVVLKDVVTGPVAVVVGVRKEKTAARTVVGSGSCAMAYVRER